MQPGNAEFQSLYASALLQSSKPKQAVIAFQKAFETAPDRAEDYYNRALADNEVGAAATAECGFREALLPAPDHQDARFNLGQLLRKTAVSAKRWNVSRPC